MPVTSHVPNSRRPPSTCVPSRVSQTKLGVAVNLVAVLQSHMTSTRAMLNLHIDGITYTSTLKTYRGEFVSRGAHGVKVLTLLLWIHARDLTRPGLIVSVRAAVARRRKGE